MANFRHTFFFVFSMICFCFFEVVGVMMVVMVIMVMVVVVVVMMVVMMVVVMKQQVVGCCLAQALWSPAASGPPAKHRPAFHASAVDQPPRKRLEP